MYGLWSILDVRLPREAETVVLLVNSKSLEAQIIYFLLLAFAKFRISSVARLYVSHALS